MTFRKMQIYQVFFFSLVLAFSLATVHCGGTLDPCIDFDCPEGQVCVDDGGTAVCQVPSNGGGGSGEQGDSCETTDDCMTGLVCTSGVDGLLTCEPE